MNRLAFHEIRRAFGWSMHHPSRRLCRPSQKYSTIYYPKRTRDFIQDRRAQIDVTGRRFAFALKIVTWRAVLIYADFYKTIWVRSKKRLDFV